MNEENPFEQAKSEIERLRSMMPVTMGVGDGTGHLFIHGTRESIQVVRAKDAEIERLKEQNESDYKITVSVCNENTDLKKVIDDQRDLITELCDALEQQSCWSTKVELIQRAREATK